MDEHLPSPRPARGRARSGVDIAVVLAIVVVGYLVAARLELFERYAGWSQRHERFDADELVMATVVGIVGLAVFSWRRHRESLAEARQLASVLSELAETDERYRSLFDYHPGGVFSLTTDGRFDSANRSAQEMCGYDEAELRTMSFVDLVPVQELETVVVAFVEIMERRPRSIETTVRRKDGRSIELELTGLPIVIDDEVVGVFGVAVDVTERNRLQHDLEQARQAAEQANEAKSLFLANMSHEIRTPLTTVLAAAEMLRDTELDTRQVSLTQSMARAGARLLRLVDEVLDFSRVEAGVATMDHTEFDPRTLIEDVVSPARDAARDKGLSFEGALDGSLPPRVHGDGGRIAQVLSNLLDNAVKFTEQGFVRVSAHAEPIGAERLDLHLEVADSGIGMNPEDTGRVFETFRQADPSITRKYGGTGLGLAIAKQLVELMDGTIAVTSAPGEGTTFRVRLPLAAA